MTSKELEARIISLENYLGLNYILSEYPEHIASESYGLMHDLKKALKKESK